MKLATCHPDRKHKAHGLCVACYQKSPKRKAECKHPDRPVRARGLCGACYESALRAESPEYDRKCSERRKQYYILNGEALRKREAERYREKGGESAWACNIRTKYGVTPEWYEKQRTFQGDKCAICERPFALEKKRPAIDHCHQSGRVRGLLCQMCNTALGCAEDAPDILRKMADYLDTCGVATVEK